MITRLNNWYVSLGLNSSSWKKFCVLGIVISISIISVLFLTTSSLVMAVAIYVCLLVQVLDSLQQRSQKRKRLQDSDWPKFLDAIHSAIWAGASLEQAFLDSRAFTPRNTQTAFAEFERDVSSGVGLDVALANYKARLADPIADRFIELTRLANSVGGRGYLGALRAQSVQLRLENTNWEEISNKQNWVIGSAKMAVFAPWLVLIMLSFRTETTYAFQGSVGTSVLLLGLVASLAAFRLVKYLGRIPVRQRTLVP